MTSLVQAITPGRSGRVGGAGGERRGVEGVMRTSKMYEEAEDFSRRMSEFARGLHTFQHATTDFISCVIPMMSAPLPRVWDQLPDGGLAEPLRAKLSHDYPSELLGADVDINGIRAAVLEMERRLVTGINRPLLQWREALETARQRLPEVERLRRELAREQSGLDRTFSKAEQRHRREVGLDQPHGLAGLLFRCTHPGSTSPSRPRITGGQVAAADAAEGTFTEGEEEAEGAAGGHGGAGAVVAPGGGGGGGRGFREEFRVEDRNMKTVYQARRREAILKSFTEQEGLLNEQLSGLCRDASWLKSYMVASLVATKEGMQAVTHFLGSTKQPVPGHAEGLEARARGNVAPNDDLIRQVPKFLIDHTSRMQALERIRGRMGREGLHAHRAIASPMELHARGDIRGGEYIDPVRRGASERPLGAAAEAPAGPSAAGMAAAPAGTAAAAAEAPGSTAAAMGGEDLLSDEMMGGGGSGAVGGAGAGRVPPVATDTLRVVGGQVLPMGTGGMAV